MSARSTVVSSFLFILPSPLASQPSITMRSNSSMSLVSGTWRGEQTELDMAVAECGVVTVGLVFRLIRFERSESWEGINSQPIGKSGEAKMMSWC